MGNSPAIGVGSACWRERLYEVVYLLCRIALWFVLRLLPPEAFNRLCQVLPGRLILHGLRYYGASVGEHVNLTPPITFHNIAKNSALPFAQLAIGSHCYLGRGILLDLKDRIELEDRVTLAMGVTLVTHTDVGESPLAFRGLPPTRGAIVVRQGAYIGAGATLLQGVEVGRCSVIGSGAVVVRSVPPNACYGGVPARPLHGSHMGA